MSLKFLKSLQVLLSTLCCKLLTLFICHILDILLFLLLLFLCKLLIEISHFTSGILNVFGSLEKQEKLGS